jgi:hypothetical protein
MIARHIIQSLEVEEHLTIPPADEPVPQACYISSFKFLRLNPIQM